MFKNDYGELIENWKAALIVSRAIRIGFRRHDLEDVQQQIVVAILDFEFDPAKSNGASEATAITALIDKQLKAIQRARARYSKRVVEHTDESREKASMSLADRYSAGQVAQSLDVREAVADLPPPEQQICTALADGLSVNEIARALGVGWHTIRRQVCGIRGYFEFLGLDGNATA